MPKKQSKKTSNNQNKKITNYPIINHPLAKYLTKSKKTITPIDLTRLDFDLSKYLTNTKKLLKELKELKEPGIKIIRFFF